MISDTLIPLLSDFGLARVVEDIASDYPEWVSADTTTANRAGAVRWLAPELLGLNDEHGNTRPLLTTETDVYSLAMVIIEVSFDMLFIRFSDL